MPFVGTRAARWVLRKLNGRRETVRRYMPDFSGRQLERALTGRSTHHGEPGPESRRAAVLRARQLFGRRFFLQPENVPALWQRLESEFPDWALQLRRASAADIGEGLPIYNIKAPPLGARFPWDRLPAGPGEDGMYIKRPHRFSFAPRSGLACVYDARAEASLRDMLEAWVVCATGGSSPYCYDSNLGVIQRLLALSWCWVFLASRHPEDGRDLDLEWLVLRIIQADVCFLEPRLGDSTPNNHLLADRFAAWYLRAVFPELLGSSEGDEEARWRDELLAQTYPDGGSFEHSAHYHEFACEMGAAYLLLCARGGRQPDRELEERVKSLLRFQVALTGPESLPLPLGNGVEDTLFPLDSHEGWCPGSLRELYRALFCPELASAPRDRPDVVRAYWLLGGRFAPSLGLPDRATGMMCFPDSGLYVQADAQLSARLTFRAGPSPDRPVVFGHMHADLLSVYLSVNGSHVLVDAGTYTYRTTPRPCTPESTTWRQYFVGPAAHNGLTIHGHDPLGEVTRDFRKSNGTARVPVVCHSLDGVSFVHAEITGAGAYTGAMRTSIHVHGAYWLLIDSPPPNIPSDAGASYGFQFADHCSMSVEKGGVKVGLPGRSGYLTLVAAPGTGPPVLLEGSCAPLGGWVSPQYGACIPAPQVRYSVPSSGDICMFLLQVDSQPCACLDTTVGSLENASIVARVTSDRWQDILLYDLRPLGDELLRYEGILFKNGFVWIRMVGKEVRALRYSEATIINWEEKGIRIGTV